ncbi:MAG: adenylate kinase [Pseudomonadota bacterium]
MRIAIFGNAGSGKSTLSRKLAAQFDLPLVEVDTLLWRPGWQMVPEAEYEIAHAAAMDEDAWVMDGMGYSASLNARMQRATHVILCDFPIWQNYWLLAERQSKMAQGDFDGAPAGVAERPETRALFEFTWRIHETLMPMLRTQVAALGPETNVSVIQDFDALTRFELSV